MERLLPFASIALILTIAWLISEDRKKFPIRIVVIGIILQFIIAAFILNVDAGIIFFRWIGDRITDFLGFTRFGAEFVFGNLVKAEHRGTFGYIFAFNILPTLIFFSTFMSILYYLGVMQRVIYAIGWLMSKTLGTSGTESLAAAANIFFGQTESVLVVKPYLETATRSEMNAMMIGGFVTVSGAVLAAFISLGIPAQWLIASSIVAAPAGLLLAKIVIPANEGAKSIQEVRVAVEKTEANLMEAAAQGAGDGMKLALNVATMLIAFIALLAMVDGLVGFVGGQAIALGWESAPTSLRQIFGFFLTPFGLLLGLPPAEASIFGSLLGTKVSINEFVAFADLLEMMQNNTISERTARIATFSLCGFANFASVAIQIGGIGGLAPSRRSEIASLGLRAMFVGVMGNLMTASVISIITP